MFGQGVYVNDHHAQNKGIQAQPKQGDINQKETVVCREYGHGHVSVQAKAQRSGSEQFPAQGVAEGQSRGDREVGQSDNKGNQVLPCIWAAVLTVL